MPEVILPCTHCRTDRYLSVQSFKALKFMLFRVICNGCGVSGPAGDTRKSAIEAHNALPRALTWTHEPPKVAGWYSWMSGKGQNITMIQTHIFNGVCGYWDGNGVFRTDLNRGEWAGPIPAPID